MSFLTPIRGEYFLYFLYLISAEAASKWNVLLSVHPASRRSVNMSRVLKPQSPQSSETAQEKYRNKAVKLITLLCQRKM